MIHPESKAPSNDAPAVTIVFFGLGAVGASMLICLAELAERDGIEVRFLVFTIDPAGAQDALYHAEEFMNRIELAGVQSFDPVLACEPPYDRMLDGASLLVNAALPIFNDPLIELGMRLGVHTVDLAADMYTLETSKSLTFSQYAYDRELRERGITALINMGISPGITNFLIGEHIRYLRGTGRKELSIESVDLYLLEDIDADTVIFSWSPAIALEELSQHPRHLCKGKMVTSAPFTYARDYTFPHEQRPCRQYPLYQEELLSLHRSYPDIETIRIFTGGYEVELVKALYQLNLFSKASVGNNSDLTVDAIVRAVMPGMKKPRRIEDLLRSGVIRRAHFCAVAEIRVREFVRNELQTSIQTIGLSFLRYHGLLNTPYAGATYISYPTAVGAAILTWHTICHIWESGEALGGVVTGEELAGLLPRERIDAVRRDLVGWDINLFESVRDAEDS
ncbi:MAG: saccharopine dehydrogenase C-terminal domain-containing protein [Candidatus Eremiobacteraeota bacterium]|nr:saccharopine dehydrogenase C-terminal domain-containing protein [Candidatus Eremiobacteraeota bacterium]